VHDLAIIIVSTNEAKWLRPCLTTLHEHAGAIDLDVVVVDNESTDGTRELVESEFGWARVVDSENHGFSHANNRGLLTCNARYALFLNPDTEILEGTFEELVAALDARPGVGLAGVRQLTPSGEVFPTIRWFPNGLRAIGEAVLTERVPHKPRWLGERELSPESYERETPCDWTSGSFMIARREALAAAGYLDERFFIFSEETDLCYRIKRVGWDVRHLPSMTILHHADKVGFSPRMEAQNAWTRLQYARKHFSAPHRAVYATAVFSRYLLRFVMADLDRDTARERRIAYKRTMRTMLGLEPPPFGAPPGQAVALSQRAPPER
jgi:N-acetylglucosaminyl-diphospho-decaprenol L-rhamnosyltransferase